MRGDVGVQEGVGRRYSLCAGTNAALTLALLALAQPACGGGLHGPAFDAERNAMRTKPPGGLGAPGGGGWLFGQRKESAQDVMRRVVAIDLEDVVAEAPAGEELVLGVSTGRIGTGGRSASNGVMGGEGWGAADSLMGGRRQLAQAAGVGEKGNVCPDCGPVCVETKVAKPMRGECYGPTPVRFYKGDEVRPGQNLWRVQYLPLRVCVQTDGQGNRRAGTQESGLQRMTPSLLELDVPAIQDRCQSLWQDIDVPPSYFHTCNDPTGTEEAQIAGYALEEFDPLLLGTFRQSVAQAMNNLKQNNSGLSVTQDNIRIIKTFAGTACASMNVNETVETETEKPVDVNGTITLVKVTETQVKTTAVTLQDNPCECTVGNSYEIECPPPTACCANRLVGDPPGIRVHFHVVGLSAQKEEVDQILFGGEVLGLEIEKEFGKITGRFPQVTLRLGRDATPCGGPFDISTCILGDVCRPISDRSSFTDFVSRDWWVRTDARWYGGTIPPNWLVREWYCDYDPRLFVGKVRVGQLGYSDFYLRNSNLQVKSECDHDEEAGITLQGGLSKTVAKVGNVVEESGLDPNRNCATVNTTDPVPFDCCGYCFLSNIHLTRLWNCTGMQDILNNDEAIAVLAKYCTTTRLCREYRPCFGEPVQMGDPFALLRSSTYDVWCDPLNRGCNTPYIDGRPLKPGERKCGYKWACDHRISSIRNRIGYYWNDSTIFPPFPPPKEYYVMSAGVAAAITVTSLCCSGIAVVLYRRWRFIRDKKARQLRKEQLKFLRKRDARTANSVPIDVGEGS